MIRRLHDTDDLVRAFPRVHFVGIGGTGMSGIAEVMLTWAMKCPARTRRRTPPPAAWRGWVRG